MVSLAYNGALGLAEAPLALLRWSIDRTANTATDHPGHVGAAPSILRHHRPRVGTGPRQRMGMENSAAPPSNARLARPNSGPPFGATCPSKLPSPAPPRARSPWALARRSIPPRSWRRHPCSICSSSNSASRAQRRWRTRAPALTRTFPRWSIHTRVFTPKFTIESDGAEREERAAVVYGRMLLLVLLFFAPDLMSLDSTVSL